MQISDFCMKGNRSLIKTIKTRGLNIEHWNTSNSVRPRAVACTKLSNLGASSDQFYLDYKHQILPRLNHVKDNDRP